MIYFDNSASSYIKPKEVINATIHGITSFSANPGRSGHKLSMLCGEKVFEVREKVKRFINAEKVENVIFTQNCTEALNIAVIGTMQKGGHIILSSNAHNSLSRPIFELKKMGLIDVTVVSPSNNELLTIDDIIPNVKPNTYLIAVNHVSNVNGDTTDIHQIGEYCAKNCILFLVDCAQSAGHIKIDVQKDHIDMLALAPHKALFALQGIGIFAFSIKTNPKPIKFGGTGTESINTYQPNEYPECLESGTLATPNIISLGAGIDYVNKNFDSITKKVNDLSTYILFELQKIEGVKTYTSVENIHFGVIGFNIKNVDSQEIASILSDEFNICVRGGLHCAGLKHKELGTVNQGIFRASISFFNTFGECEYFVNSIKKIAKRY